MFAEFIFEDFVVQGQEQWQRHGLEVRGQGQGLENWECEVHDMFRGFCAPRTRTRTKTWGPRTRTRTLHWYSKILEDKDFPRLQLTTLYNNNNNKTTRPTYWQSSKLAHAPTFVITSRFPRIHLMYPAYSAAWQIKQRFSEIPDNSWSRSHGQEAPVMALCEGGRVRAPGVRSPALTL